MKNAEYSKNAENAENQPVVTNDKRKWIVLAVVTLIAAGLISYFASPHPDGLERVAEDNGFLHTATEPSWTAWIPDYELPGISSPLLKVGLAGIIGAGLLFLALYGLTRTLSRGNGGQDDVGKSDHPSS